ncbi:nicotinamide riboside transporter PnuC [Niabella yanshanensis]|uniref:Nicotinamide riboside transporter PnuC n=1 Tax=Niabella yanshanensis TaxID=577386 RepID=A0ABZ0W0Z4_9BACT|nr:nicotinamide riboside transporter PnuC [Niabella yanshanensis]WQD36594.1 nicotinamide riboside transporter PnuC [Niabella yanshanensis]
MQEFFNQLISGLKATTIPEYIAVLAGIASVWYSRKENILVYPTGLLNTIIYIWLSFKYHLLGEASVNFYYTLMNMYGWYLWTRKDKQQQAIIQVRFSSAKEWLGQLSFFAFFYLSIFFALSYLKKAFAPGAIPWADALASASAFTGMWLMAKKKVESWYWWVITNICGMPLYFVKGLVFTSVYYFVLLILAIGGLMEWRRRAYLNRSND